MASNKKKPKNFRKTMIKLLGYMMKDKFILIIATACAMVTPVFTVRATYLLKPAINDYIMPLVGAETVDLSDFIKVLAKMGMFYLLAAGTLLIQTKLMTKVCHDTINSIRCDLFEHMQTLPISYFDTMPRGQIMSCYSSDVYTLSTMLKQSLPQLVNGVVSMVSIFASMLTLDLKLTAVVVVYLFIVVFVNKYIISNGAKYSKDTQESIREMNGFIEEMVDGQELVKLYTREDQLREQFAKESDDLYETSTKARLFTSIIFPISNGLSNTGFALVAIIGVYMVMKGSLDVGTVCAFIQFYRQFHIPVVQVSRQLGNVFSALAGAERIFIMLAEPSETNEGSIRLEGEKEEAGDIDLKEMVFGYVPEKQVLKGIDLNVKPGQKIAFVGSSGAGKTTIASLINRFYDVTGGSITYDGTDIRQIDKYDLRKQISIVLQDTHLFTGTIMENIRFGRLEATDEEVKAAAKMVNADFFIEHLPDKYDTYLESDGAMLSDGQRQLLSIARAAVSKAPILIMDEATSLVDTRTELLIEQGLRALMDHKTVFMIAHRLSTVRNADIIVVLKNGLIAECGNHDELMALKGMYYDLNTGSYELL